MKTLSKRILLLVSIGIATIMINSAHAQVFWLQSYDNDGGTLEFRKLSSDFDDYFSGYTLLANAHFRISPRLMSFVQLPIAHGKEDYSTYYYYSYDGPSEFSGTAIGNFYLGLEQMDQKRSGAVFQAGARLPITDDPHDIGVATALSYGAAATFEQFEAFVPKLLMVHVAGGYQAISATDKGSGIRWKSIFGPTLMKPSDNEAELFGDGSSEFWFDGKPIRFGVGIIARAIITEDVPNFGDRFSVQSGATIVGVFGSVRPQIRIHVPLTNDLRDAINLVYAFAIGFDFGGQSGEHSDDEF